MAGPRAGRGAQPLVQQHTFQENKNRANWAFDNLTYISAVEMYVKSAAGCRPTRPMPPIYSSPASKSALTSCRLSHTREARARISGVGWCRSGTITVTKPPAAPALTSAKLSSSTSVRAGRCPDGARPQGRCRAQAWSAPRTDQTRYGRNTPRPRRRAGRPR